MIEHRYPVIAHHGGHDENGYYRTAYCEECKEQISVWYESDGDMDSYWNDCVDHVQNKHLKIAFVTEK